MMYLKDVQEQMQGILDTHNKTIRGMYEGYIRNISKAYKGFSEGKYQKTYYTNTLSNCKNDMENMFKGYKEQLVTDLNIYKHMLEKEIKKSPKDTDYTKATYHINLLKSIAPGTDASIHDRDLYYKAVKSIAIDTPHLADDVLLLASQHLEPQQISDIQNTTKAILGLDILDYVQDTIDSIAINCRHQEEEGQYVLRTAIEVTPYHTKKYDTLELKDLSNN